MEKQIETVYVLTDEAPYLVVKDVEKQFIKARVTEQEAYLYTPEEHAAVQQALLEEFTKGVKAGLESPNAAAALFPNAALQKYREALEKIESISPSQSRQWKIANAALSTAEDKGEAESAVDRAWTYLAKCKHITDKNLGDGFPDYNVLRALQMVAKEQPENNLDELEYYQNARESFSNAVSNLDIQTRTACDSFILAFDHLLNCSKPNNGWISVEDRLPEYRNGCSNSEDVNILIHHEGEYEVTTGSYSYHHKKWMEYLYNDKYNTSITHWQPLPPKP